MVMPVWHIRRLSKDLYVANLNQCPVAHNLRVPGRTLDVHQIILKINESRLIPVKEIYEPQIHIIRVHPIHGVIPIATTLSYCFSIDHNRNVRHWHYVQMNNRFDPRETITLRTQKSGCALIMSTAPENERRE